MEARLMGFNPNNIRPPQQPALHYDNQVGNPFQYAYIRRSSTMKKEQIPIVSANNKLAATQLKVSVQGSHVHNHADRTNEAETPSTNEGGTEIFSKRQKESKNKIAPAMKKGIEVMAFRPASSGHSPGMGHGNTPGTGL